MGKQYNVAASTFKFQSPMKVSGKMEINVLRFWGAIPILVVKTNYIYFLA